MAPTIISLRLALPLLKREPAETPTKASLTLADVTLEAWGQGFNVGSLVVLVLLVLCNYRRHVLLHKLILLEVWRGVGGRSTEPSRDGKNKGPLNC
jgi:hypothetical protein